MKTATKKSGEEKNVSGHDKAREPLKTDLPLSEKDEVKQAEEKMRKSRGKLL